MPFRYSHPQVDSIPAKNQVTVQSAIPSVTDVEAAIALYLTAFRQQFRGQREVDRRAGRLARFLTYLQVQQHSMQLAELTYADGQEFLNTLLNVYTGEVPSLSVRKTIRVRYGVSADSWSGVISLRRMSFLRSMLC